MGDQKSSFSVKDLCSILKACGAAQVDELKLGDLYVRFRTQTEPPSPLAEPEEVTEPSPPPAVAIAATQEKIAELTQVQDELAMRQDQLDLMMIEDPLRAEELMAQGELELDAGSDEEEI